MSIESGQEHSTQPKPIEKVPHAGNHPDPSVREVPQKGFETLAPLNKEIVEGVAKHWDETVETTVPDHEFQDRVLLGRATGTTTETAEPEVQPKKKSRRGLKALGAVVIAGVFGAGGYLLTNGEDKDPAPQPVPTATASGTPGTITNPNNVPSVPPTGGVESPAPTPTSSVEAPVVDPVQLLERSPAEFNGLDRNSRLVAGHWLMQEANQYLELYVGDNDDGVFESNPVMTPPQETDSGQSILDQFRFGRQLVMSQKVDPKDNYVRTLDKKQASHALSVPYYYTDADPVHLKGFDDMTNFINSPEVQNVDFQTEKFTLVSESPVKTGLDRDGKEIKLKDIVYTSSKNPTTKKSNSFVFTSYNAEGKEYHVWQMLDDI